MASVFSKEINKLAADTIKTLRSDKKLLEDIGSYIEEQIRKRTRLGKGVADQGAKFEKLSPLKRETIERRKALKKSGDLTGPTTPKKSNLTLTGSMLESLGYTVQGNKIILDIDGKDPSGGDNRKKAEHHNKTRPFLYLSDTELKTIERMIRKRALELFTK